MAKSRASSPKRASNRKASWARGKERKAAARKLHEENRKRNVALRREGSLTPQEARREAHRAARKLLNLKEQPRNERGFIVEANGKLRDPGNWARRRNVRHDAIANGFLSVETSPPQRRNSRGNS